MDNEEAKPGALTASLGSHYDNQEDFTLPEMSCRNALKTRGTNYQLKSIMKTIRPFSFKAALQKKFTCNISQGHKTIGSHRVRTSPVWH